MDIQEMLTYENGIPDDLWHLVEILTRNVAKQTLFLLLLADRVIGSYESAFIDSDVVLAKKCEILLTDDTSENSLVQNSQ